MTFVLLVCCDGTPADRPGMTLERCRAFLPVRAAELAAPAERVTAAGYATLGARHLCPSCMRAREATS